MKLLKQCIIMLSLLLSYNLNAEDYSAVNVKLIFDNNQYYSDAGYNFKDGFGNYFEIETLAQRGNFNFYGFVDVRNDTSISSSNYDFYKYILKYDLTNGNSKLFVNYQIKETYGFNSDSFIGLGTNIDAGLMGVVSINAYYFANYNDDDNKSSMPFSIAFNWYKFLKKDLVQGWDLAHGGWSDIDLYTDMKNDNNGKSRVSMQVYEGVSLSNKDYGVELGYKFFRWSLDSVWSNSLYLSFIKKF